MRRLVAQAVLYAAFAAAIALFSGWPVYRHLAPGRSLIKLSITHQAQRLGDCKPLTPDELAKLPPNMRAPTRCPRERAPLAVEVDIDGTPALRRVAQPSGLARDGAAAVYQRLEVDAGEHDVAVRLKDRAGEGGFDYTGQARVSLAAAQVLVIDFDPGARRITFR